MNGPKGADGLDMKVIQVKRSPDQRDHGVFWLFYYLHSSVHDSKELHGYCFESLMLGCSGWVRNSLMMNLIA